MPTAADFPTYDDLRHRTDAPPGSTWGLFAGERGMAALAGAAEVRAAAGLVRTGEVFNLDHPLDVFAPPLAPTRHAPRHEIFSRHRDHRDDRLDGFYPQAGTQVDGLRHRRHAEFGFYDGVPDAAVTESGPALGVGRWAEAPIVGRAVLADLARHQPIDHASGAALPVALVEETLRAQGTELCPGDLLLIRTGWTGWYLSSCDEDARARVRRERRFTGLAQSRELLAWLYDHRVALAASDTFALEVLPPMPGSAFGGDTDHGMVHQDLIALLGLPIGELWRLDPLAEACAADRRWDCLLVVKPLNLPAGVGSPANATAIR
jgi:hypothetical protein